MLQKMKSLKNMKLGETILVFDRDHGRIIFRGVRGYGNLLDDAEWLLERTPQRTWGFMIRSIINNGQYGLWIGEYTPSSDKVTREETIFSRGSSTLSKLLLKYDNGIISEKEINRRINDVETLRKLLPESNIIRDFQYFVCPKERLYSRCPHVGEIYEALKERYYSAGRLHYFQAAEIMSKINKCRDVIICPLTASPNALESLLLLDKVLRNRKIGCIRIVDRNNIELS